MSRLLRWYQSCLQKHPWKTQAINTGILMAIGDFTCQTLVEKRRTWESYDKFRTVRFTAVGAIIVGPLFHTWYRTLDGIKLSGKLIPVKKMCIDQGMFTPIFLWNFIGLMGILQGHSIKEVKERLSEEYLDVMKNNYMIWPIVQAINFTFVPLPFRVLVVNVICVFWNTYLAWVAHKNIKHDEEISPKVYFD